MRNLYIISLFIMMSCQNDSKFDLSDLNEKKEVNKNLKKLDISNIKIQKGYWKLINKDKKIEAELSNDDNISTIYNLKDYKDEQNFHFDNVNIQKETGGLIVENKGKIAFVNISLDNTKTFNVLKKLKESLGKPDQVISEKTYYDLKDEKLKLILKEFDSNEISKIKDEFDDEYLVYPLHYIWNMDGYIYKYTLFITEKNCSNNLIIISNKAFNEKLIFGYHNPKDDPIFKKYYNE